MAKVDSFAMAPSSVVVVQGALWHFFLVSYETLLPEFGSVNQRPELRWLYEIDFVGESFVNNSMPCSEVESPPMPSQEDSRKFKHLSEQWKSERGAMSWVVDMATCRAYQSIIGMGPVAIPLILAQLESEGDEPDHWFWALRALTGVNPVTADDRGNIVKIAQAWITWGRSAGYAR